MSSLPLFSEPSSVWFLSFLMVATQTIHIFQDHKGTMDLKRGMTTLFYYLFLPW